MSKFNKGIQMSDKINVLLPIEEQQKSLEHQFVENLEKLKKQGIVFVGVTSNMRHLTKDDLQFVNWSVDDEKVEL